MQCECGVEQRRQKQNYRGFADAARGQCSKQSTSQQQWPHVFKTRRAASCMNGYRHRNRNASPRVSPQDPPHARSYLSPKTHLISIGACEPPPPITCANPLSCVGLGPMPGAAPSAAPAAAAPAKPPGALPPAELLGNPNPHPVPLPKPGFCVF